MKNTENKAPEQEIYEKWEASSAFQAKPSPKTTPYTIMMPPPNVTGSLHVGHALTMTLQDTLIRWRRMRGEDVLWQPGTDHAGIATQMVVERLLSEQGVKRQDLGRDEFLKHVWRWKDESGGKITQQLRRLGSSVDWSRERFTMDPGMSAAVIEAFVSLHSKGLIYRDRRLVNWDPKFQSAISDLEVENKETKGHLWYIRYPVENLEGQFIIVATTRPETMLGDVAIAVHPDDARYKDLLGRHAILPLTGKRIPIIADEHSDPEKGTGAVKITPAHDFNDFAVGVRHELSMPTILDREGRITLEEIESELRSVQGIADPGFVRALAGLDRFDARKKILSELETAGLLEKAEPHVNQVPYAERGGAIIEPRLTTQWFCNAAELAKPAVAAVERGDTQFVPQQWENTFFAWMTNLQPWCISRQLWWGHRIPAWYGPDGTVFVRHTEDEAHKAAAVHYGHPTELTQDEDVLDTWFSSALWPFSTLGWPEKTPELSRYYPGDVLVTGFDIIFFWVSRMMMMGMHFMGEVPFRKVFIHGLVRDERGHKMSKTKGNVIDPLELMDAYGTDALRWTVCSLSGPGRNLNLGASRVETSRNFVTKLRNAAAFWERNGIITRLNPASDEAATPLCRWMLGETARLITQVGNNLDSCRFDEYTQTLYHFVWNTFCDWFIELSKPMMQDARAQEIRETAGYVIGVILRLLHPSMPFVTEELWSKLGYGEIGSLITAPWPAEAQVYHDDTARQELEWLIRFITSIRIGRAEASVPPSKTVPILLQGASDKTLSRIGEWSGTIEKLARGSSVSALEGAIPEQAMQIIVDEVTIVLPLSGVIDLGAERKRLASEISKAQENANKLDIRLSSPDFVSKAPPEIIEESRKTLAAVQEEVERLTMALKRIAS